MNTYNAHMLADHLAKQTPETFNLSYWCGTACCIAGHAAMLSGAGKLKDPSAVFSTASDWLDIDRSTASELFEPSAAAWKRLKGVDPYVLTPAQVSKVVRKFADTGEIDYGAAL